jgi:hypothetical protein
MILIQWKFWTISCVVIQVFIIFSAIYVYQTNAKRDPDDPKKKDFSPYAPWLAPFILPLMVLINIPMVILSSLTFGFFLVVFPFTLLLFRKPFLIKWILKQAQKVGNLILEINTELLKTMGLHPASIRFQYEQETPA